MMLIVVQRKRPSVPGSLCSIYSLPSRGWRRHCQCRRHEREFTSTASLRPRPSEDLHAAIIPI